MADQPRGAIARIVDHSAFRYLLIGGASFALDVGILALLHEVFGWPLWLATGTSFLLSFVFNYSLQKSFSFGSRGQHVSTLVKYLVLLAFNTGATVLIVALIDSTVLGWGGGKVVATIVTTVWNYFAYRYWVFRAPRADLSTPPA
ncbi:GtrA family protein [Compostimonas suwonensis]|uniref:Putative flippase GtrA n=1 Tax=Compostimonas suwonensis TaxID=1048394 RepID=A0A2M9BUW0_9MICO|nr:GtrA family protein [Compostimonas suwonensis]PJJ61733.1 putative flippase GtrA [Compostimonas suwonensis]